MEPRPFFAYTQGKFWGGANADYVILALLACFPLTGLLGVDHLYMRSPLTAMLKTVLNVLTLGLWYFYDMAQVLTESATVREVGYSVPVLGPIGLGAGLFGTGAEPTTGPNPLRFLAYVAAALLPLPFGQDFFVAGDTWGGIMKLVTLFIPIFWLFGLVWSLYVVFRIFFQTESLLTEGVPRFFPFTLFMDKYYCPKGTLGPDRPCGEPAAAGADQGLLMRLLGILQGIPILGRLVDPIVTTAQVAKQTTEELVNQTLIPVTAAVPAVAATANKVLETVPAAATAAIEEVGKLTDPSALLAQALNKQRGGGANESFTGALLLFIVGAAASGYFAARIRKSEYISLLPEAFQTILHTPARGPSDIPPLPRKTA